MMNFVAKSQLFSGCLSLPRLNCVATISHFIAPVSYKDVEFPENRKLKFMPKVPAYPTGIKPPKVSKRLIDIRGPEQVHNTLIYKQYGIMSLQGIQLQHGHLEMIRNTINRKLNTKTSFAEWRIDAPWKPVTKKGQGKRMGGGKGAIHHYVTPIKAGRIIVEMGGTLSFLQAKPLLVEVAQKLPVKALVVSQEMMEELAAEDKQIEEENINPYTYQYVVENNLLGCHRWISPYDLIWHGKHR